MNFIGQMCVEEVYFSHKNRIGSIKVFSPTDPQLDSLKNNIKFALKLTLKSSYLFWCKTPSSGSISFEPC
jgi:hypothetical protein